MNDEAAASATEKRGPLGDARPDATEDDPRKGGGQPVEDPENRHDVGSVTPEDYPEKARGGV